ncbi:MAG: hypothetical protein R3F37_16230 [Candidatus Competibacteraceae bacterium]
MNDEIIQELHAIKDALAAKFNADLRLIFADIKRGEKNCRLPVLLWSNLLQILRTRRVQHYSDPVSPLVKLF